MGAAVRSEVSDAAGAGRNSAVVGAAVGAEVLMVLLVGAVWMAEIAEG